VVTWSVVDSLGVDASDLMGVIAFLLIKSLVTLRSVKDFMG